MAPESFTSSRSLEISSGLMVFPNLASTVSAVKHGMFIRIFCLGSNRFVPANRWPPRQKIQMSIPYLTAETVLAKFNGTAKHQDATLIRTVSLCVLLQVCKILHISTVVNGALPCIQVTCFLEQTKHCNQCDKPCILALR